MRDVDEILSAYKVHHTDSRNELFHFIGVPTVTLSLLIIFNWIRLPVIPVGLGSLFGIAILIYYFTLDRDLSLVVFLFCTPLLILAEVVAQLPSHLPYSIGAGTFIIGWIFQLLGHLFEKNLPALLTNPRDALAAPLFLANKLLKKRTV